MTYSLITLLIITEYSDSDGVWKVGGVWNTTQRAELTERMKRLRATNTQPDNSTLRRMEGQEMTHLRQQLREMTRQLQQKEQEIKRNAETIQQNEATIRRKDQQLEQKEATIRINERELERNAETIQQNEATIHQLQSDIREKDLQIQQKNNVIQRHEGTITQQRRVITSYRDNPSQLIEQDMTGEVSKEAMLIQLNQSRELAEGVTV